MKLVVVGGGVIGLTTAVELLEKGHQVTIYSSLTIDKTTSYVAAAIWYPEKLEPHELTKAMAERSYAKFALLSKDPTTGVVVREGVKYFYRKMGFPWWKNTVLNFRVIEKEKLPTGVVTGFYFSTFVIDTSIYLEKYLLNRFKKLGGIYKIEKIDSLTVLMRGYEAAVNCTGLGAKTLVRDEALYCKRGQLVRVEKLVNQDFIMGSDSPQGMVYIIPRIHDCVLGGVSEEGNYSMEVNLKQSQEIIERCTLEVDEIKNVKILSTHVGLRPYRPTLRLEIELIEGKKLVHQYGHGGNGVTLSWGSSQLACELLLK